MKRLFLLFIVLLSLHSLSQDTTSWKMKLGIKAAGERSAYLDAMNDDYKSYTFGGQAVFHLERKSSLETGVYFVNRIIGVNNNNFYYRNIAIPVNYRYDFGYFYAAGGLFGDYLFNVGTSGLNSNPLDPSRKIQFGWNVCAGLEFPLRSSYHIFFEGRYFRHIARKTTFSPGFVNYGLALGINRSF